VPDYVANAGGLIQVGSELGDATAADVEEKVRGIERTAREILHLAVDQEMTPLEAARRIVQRRLDAARAARTA
jgi:valine dehydrogenase (NAD+)